MEGKPKVAKNFQGYPMDKCKFHPQLGRHCYTPFKYCKERSAGKFAGPVCKDCFLQPCFTLVKNKLINEEGEKLRNDKLEEMEFLYAPKEECLEILNREMKEDVMMGIFQGIFSKTYAKKVGLPACAHRCVDRTWPCRQEAMQPKVMKSPCRKTVWEQIVAYRKKVSKEKKAERAKGRLSSVFDSDSESDEEFMDHYNFFKATRTAVKEAGTVVKEASRAKASSPTPTASGYTSDSEEENEWLG